MGLIDKPKHKNASKVVTDYTLIILTTKLLTV